MKIHVFETRDATVPPANRFMARLRERDWLPVYIWGSSEAEAYANAENWLNAEIAKERARA